MQLDTSLIKDIEAVCLEQKDELISFTCDLVSEPSLLGEEASAQRVMAQTFADMGLDIDRFAIDHEALKHESGYSPSLGEWDGHENIVGIHRSKNSNGHSLILNGHIDVVPVGSSELWSSPPFTPTVNGDRLYGRGSGDMKAGIAAYVFAFKALLKLGFKPAADVYLQSVVEEECTGNGALACLHRGYRADAAIIPEPFNETIMSAQVGVMWLQIHVTGKPAHVLNDTTGTNAIESAFKIWHHLKKLATTWNQNKSQHQPFSDHDAPIKFNLGKINGGEWASSLPTQCRMEVRCGFYPGEDPKDVRHAIESHLKNAVTDDKELANVSYQISYGGFQSPGCIVNVNDPFITLLSDTHHSVTGRQPELFASAATTDVRSFQLYGNIPSTCYGPEAQNIHGIDESVSIDSMATVSRVLSQFIAQWCGLEKI